MTTITFISTGGTVDKDYPKTRRGWDFVMGEQPAFERILSRIYHSLDLTFERCLRKDSLEITDEDRQDIITCIKQNVQKDGTHHYVITHGTDTLLDTAAYIAEGVAELKNVRVCVTGAFKPERFSEGDAAFNLGQAIAAVQLGPAGVVQVAMSGVVGPHDTITRTEEGLFVRK